MWFVKSRRAQTDEDFETWIEGAVCPTLNAFDNGTESRATVVIVMRNREGKPGGGKGPMLGEEKSFTLATANDQTLFVFPIQSTVIGRQDHNGPQGKGYGLDGDPMFTMDRVGAHGVATETTVRRLTPIECERLQGFPDNWTEGQADSHRYKQMGNAVTVNVAEWVGRAIMESLDANL